MSFTVVDHGNENVRTFGSRTEAEDKAAGIKQMVDNPNDIQVVDGAYDSYDDYQSDENDPVDPEIVDHSPDNNGEAYDLPDKPSVDEDPLTWMPNDFTDQIDGTVAINRKGYEVMAHHYGIGTNTRCVVGPEETDFEFCRCRCIAETKDGTQYTAHGSAHVKRGDDAELLVEMADTRARKRAIAQATGVGMVAVEELKNTL